MGNQVSGYSPLPQDNPFDDISKNEGSGNKTFTATKILFERLVAQLFGQNSSSSAGVPQDVLDSFKSAKWRLYALNTMNKTAALMLSRALEKAVYVSHGCSNIFSQLPGLVWQQGEQLNNFVEKKVWSNQDSRFFNYASKQFTPTDFSALLNGNLGDYSATFSKSTLLALSMCASNDRLADQLVQNGVAHFNDEHTVVSALHVAVYCLSVHEVERLIQYVLNHRLVLLGTHTQNNPLETLINLTTKSYGHSLLHVAMQSRDSNMVPYLLRQEGINLNSEQVNGLTPLHFAVFLDNVDACAALLNYPGVNVNAADLDGDTALGISMQFKRLVIIPLLIEHSQLDINANVFGGMPAIQLAILNNDTATFKLLLKHPEIRLNAPLTADWLTALHLAVKQNNIDMVEMLLEHPQVNANLPTQAMQQTPLQLAIDQKSIPIVRLMLGHPQVDVNAQANFGQSALHQIARDLDNTLLDLLASFEF